MKTFKESLQEVQQPLSQGEKNFKELHKIVPHQNLVPGVTDQEHVFNGNPRKEDPKTASYENFRDDDESKEAYDKNLKIKNDYPERDVDESRLTLMPGAKPRRSGSFGVANNKAEAARQRALKRAEGMVKRGASHEVAAREHDVSVADLKKHLGEATDDDGWYAHKEIHGDKGVSKEDWKKGWRMNSKGQKVKIKEDVELIDETSDKKKEEYVKKSMSSYSHYNAVRKDAESRGDEDIVKLARRKMKNRNKGMTRAMGEEVEQIAEVGETKKGKMWLAGYIQKASDARRHRKMSTKDVDKNYAGVKRASDILDKRLRGEEIESVEEGKMKSTEGSTTAARTQRGANAGMKQAKSGSQYPSWLIPAIKAHKAKKMAEEIEQIDEVGNTPRGKKILASYVKKASQDQYFRGQDVQHYSNKAKNAEGPFADQMKKKNRDLADRANKKASNRDTGIERAVNRLAKEEIEQVEEAKATYCGRCGTTHVPPSQGGKCPAVKEEAVIEKHLTPNEMKKREEIAKAIHKQDPNMPMSKKMAIATARAKEVTEAAKKLIGGQKKLDKNKNGKLDKQDFEILRGEQ